MKSISIQPNFKAWRKAARTLLADYIHPRDVLWSTDGSQCDLLFKPSPEADTPSSHYPVSASFLRLAKTVSYHRSNLQWALLYEILWTLTHGGDRQILQNTTHPTVRSLERMQRMIGRDVHKMRAFVRFRSVKMAEQHEHYVAWYEPEHRILRANADFFRKRFTGMNWSILTPDECVHWDGDLLTYTPGVSQDQAPQEDALDDLWRNYYRNTFNPARLKLKMMQSEMPKKYWKNLPEAEIIPELIQGSLEQVQAMAREQPRPVLPITRNTYLASLDARNREKSKDS